MVTEISLEPYEMKEDASEMLHVPARWVNPFKELKGLAPGLYVMLVRVKKDRTHYSIKSMGDPKLGQ